MTLLHTTGYSEVLESVKERAKKKAKSMARMDVGIQATTLLALLKQMSNTIVLLAAGEVEAASAGVSYNAFTDDEDRELCLLAAELVLHHYRDELAVIQESEEERAATAKDGVCGEPCAECDGGTCLMQHMAAGSYTGLHLCEACCK